MSRRIVIPQGFRTPETLQQGIRRQYHLLDILDTSRSAPSTDSRDILHDSLRSLRLSRTRFSRNDDTLVILVRDHVVVGRFGDCVDVGDHFESVLASVGTEGRFVVNGQHSEGVD